MDNFETKSPAKAVGVLLLTLALFAGCARDSSPAASIAQAQKLIDSGKTGEARIRLKALLVKHPEATQAHVLSAQLALDSGDAQAADNEISQLAAAELQKPQVQALRWWIDLGLGKYAEVLKALDTSTVSVGKPERARIRAKALRGTNATADALAVLRSASAEFPNDAALMVDLAETLALIGNLQQAEYELNRFLEKEPKQMDALQARGELRLRNGATVKAVEDLSAALAAAPQSWPILKRVSAELLLGDASLAVGNLALAKEQMAKLEKQFPGALGTRLLSARIALFEGRAGDAADALQTISEAMPGNARVQYMLAEAWLNSGNTARAMDLLEKRVRDAPADNTARRMLAGLLMRQNRPDRVIELLGELPQEEAQSSSETDSLLSAARLAQERAGEALATVEKKLAQRPDDAQVQLELASAYLQNGQPTRALSVLNQIRVTPPLPAAAALEMRAHLALGNDREVNRLIATLVESQTIGAETLLASADAAQEAGRQDEAARLVDRVLQREANNTGALLRRANLDFINKHYDAADKALKILIGLKPTDVQARVASARVAEAKGDVAAAQTALQAAMQASPAALEPALMLVGLQLRAGQTEAAMQALDRMIAAAPKDGVAANAAGMIFLNARRAEEARTRFGQAVEQNSNDARYWFNLGRAQVLTADRQAAAQSFERAVALRSEWVEANTAAIQLDIELKRYEVARKLAKAFADRLPTEPKTWLMVGQVAMAEGRMADAVAAFSRSFALHPSAVVAVREYQARAASGAPRPAQPLLNWLTQEPTDIDVRRLLAQFYQRTGSTQELTEQLEQIVRAAPNDVASLNNLAWALVATDPPRAEALARRARSIAPQQAAIADTLGRALIANSKYSEAAQVLQGAVQELPKDRSVRYRYALALARSGDKTAARRELQSALADGGGFDGRDAAEKLSRELGT